MSRTPLHPAGLLSAASLAFVLFLPVGAQAVVAPQLPRSYVDTTYTPPPGIVHSVNAGGNLQAALDAALPGDVVSLQAGATFVGSFTLPVKSGSGWIVVRTSAPDSSLPAPGTRIGPAYAPVLPKIVSPNSSPALSTQAGAHHFRFIGIEFAVAPTVTTTNYGLVAFGDGSSAQNALADVPHDLILDRVYIHGNPGGDLRRGVGLHSASSAVVDSYISDVHEVGADSQAIAGWNGPGPFKIANNRLEGAGENVLFGGADPSIPDLVPSDIEIRGNHFFKPRSWRIGDPTYAGQPWSVKNILELKNARRVLVTGNVFENNWLHAQNGFAILFTVRNQDGTAPWSTVEDVTFRLNIVRHTGSAVNILGTDNLAPSKQTSRILVKDNLFEDVSDANWGGSGRLFQVLDGPADVDIDHNTAFQTAEVIVAAGPPTVGFAYHNNIAPNNQYGVAGDGTFGDPLGTLALYFPGALFAKNALVGGNALDYPAANFFPSTWPAVQFTNLAGANYRLATASPYRSAGSDGKDLGADIDALAAATAGAVSGGGAPSPPDQTPPIISAVAASSLSASGAVIRWTTNEGSNSLAEYGPTATYGGSTALDPALITSHSRTLAGLQPNTLYHYLVRSADAAGNQAVSGDFTFTTPSDTTPPNITFTSPAAGAFLSGSISVTAKASDNVRVSGVRFVLDGVRLAAELVKAPYSLAWDTKTTANGAHTLTAVARDAAGNTRSATRSVTVANGPAGGGTAAVIWTALVNVTATGGVLKKASGCDGCEDAGAVSTQALASGNGYLEVTASETTTQRLIGLSRGNTGTSGADIDFAFQFWPGGTVDVRENDLYRNAETSYSPGDKFRVAVASGVVRYYKNGTLFYTSAKAPAYPLLADTSLLSAAGTLGPATLAISQP